jgi:hypothetical protein
MAGKKGSLLDNIGSVIDSDIKLQQRQKSMGRPKLNPYLTEKKITTFIPADVHRQLRLASADKGKPMVEIVVDALKSHLKSYEGK